MGSICRRPSRSPACRTRRPWPMTENGDIFADNEGVEAAIPVILGLGGTSGTTVVPTGPGRTASGELAAAVPDVAGADRDLAERPRRARCPSPVRTRNRADGQGGGATAARTRTVRNSRWPWLRRDPSRPRPRNHPRPRPAWPRHPAEPRWPRSRISPRRRALPPARTVAASRKRPRSRGTRRSPSRRRPRWCSSSRGWTRPSSRPGSGRAWRLVRPTRSGGGRRTLGADARCRAGTLVADRRRPGHSRPGPGRRAGPCRPEHGRPRPPPAARRSRRVPAPASTSSDFAPIATTAVAEVSPRHVIALAIGLSAAAGPSTWSRPGPRAGVTGSPSGAASERDPEETTSRELGKGRRP